MKNALVERQNALHSVYLSAVTFGATVRQYDLQFVQRFELPPLTAQGTRPLQSALICLQDVLSNDLMVATPERLGDGRPLVFIILAERPDPNWQKAYDALTHFTDNRQPLVILVTKYGRLAQEMRVPGISIVSLETTSEAKNNKAPYADRIASFFAWVTQAILDRCDASARGDATAELPPLPPKLTLM